jgi:S-DNA-T family DNA segregation ATPase FtsK/SpoIIIE
MASYQARQRDPLLDSNTQAILERRGKELLGAGLLIAGVLIALILGSYSPDDPSWMSATDAPAQNFLGRFGAAIASPLYIIAGLGSWGVAVLFLTWGTRFAAHRGSELAIARIIFAPIAIALGSVYASTHVPGADWSHSFGLGGLFGDTVLGAVLGLVPVTATFGLKVMSVIMAICTIAMAAFALGFTKVELRAIARFLMIGVVMTYAMILQLLGRGASSAWRGIVYLARSVSQKRAMKRTQAEEYSAQVAMASNTPQFDAQSRFAPPPVVRRPTAGMNEPSVDPRSDQPVLRAEPSVTAPRFAGFEAPEEPRKTGIFSRIPSLLKRQNAPEVELPDVTLGTDEDFGDPRIKAKIADALRNRMQKAATADHSALPVLLSERVQPLSDMAFTQAGHQSSYPEDGDENFDDAFDDFGDETYDDLSLDAGVNTPMPAHRIHAAAPTPDPKKVVQHTPRKIVQPSRRAKAEAQPALQFEDVGVAHECPPLNLLSSAVEVTGHQLSDEALEENARMLESVLDDYGVKGEIVSVRPGPVVTMYELEPAPGLKASRVIGLADDIARSMSALSARVSTVPGRSVIGIELPNVHREKVVLREILAARDFGDSNMRLPLALGKDIGGDPIVANLAKMPHLLIAGTTGSGKSVAINTMILSLLYKLTPDECRMIMIDPKMLELSVYDGIPHLLSPVVTDPKKAVVALKWVVGEMEERYRKMSKMGVRNIEGYNGRVRDALGRDEMFSRTVQTGFDDETGDPVFETDEFKPETLPYIVVIVDEMADLMMVAGKEIEACIQRLAQMARASGIHLIMATQRPSVDVITGTIKANFPTRISFQVTSKIDSRTILGEQGAEQLLGMGDMLYMAGGAKITRIHGPFVSDEEVEEVVNFLKSFGPPEYMNSVTEGSDEETENSIDMVLGLGGNTEGEDALYDQAVQIVIRDRKCSTSYIQRKLAVGYNKAARLVEQMEDNGLVSSANHVGKREILVPEQH